MTSAELRACVYFIYWFSHIGISPSSSHQRLRQEAVIYCLRSVTEYMHIFSQNISRSSVSLKPVQRCIFCNRKHFAAHSATRLHSRCVSPAETLLPAAESVAMFWCDEIAPFESFRQSFIERRRAERARFQPVSSRLRVQRRTQTRKRKHNQQLRLMGAGSSAGLAKVH